MSLFKKKAPQPEPPPLLTAGMDAKYAGEAQDAASFRPLHAVNSWLKKDAEEEGKPDDIRASGVTTRYFDAKEQARSKVSVKDGLLQNEAGLLDTIGNKGHGTRAGEGEDKNIFVMTPGGELRSAAAWESRTATPDRASADPEHEKILNMVNHSSLAAVQGKYGPPQAGKVAAAGELRVEDGKLQQISDASGHYKPTAEMTQQAIEALQGEQPTSGWKKRPWWRPGHGKWVADKVKEPEHAGVDMHDVELKLTGKQEGEKNLIASVREFEALGGNSGAEALMRDRRAMFKDELTKVARRFPQGKEVPDDEAKPTPADPATAAARRAAAALPDHQATSDPYLHDGTGANASPYGVTIDDGPYGVRIPAPAPAPASPYGVSVPEAPAAALFDGLY